MPIYEVEIERISSRVATVEIEAESEEEAEEKAREMEGGLDYSSETYAEYEINSVTEIKEEK